MSYEEEEHYCTEYDLVKMNVYYRLVKMDELRKILLGLTYSYQEVGSFLE